MKTKTNKKIEAKETYQRKHKEVREMIEKLACLIDNDYDCEDSELVNWSAVQSIAHVGEKLDDILGFLEGEY